MKSTLTLLTLLFSTTVFACPDLTGEYNCQMGSKYLTTNIQAIPNGFLINTDGVEAEFVADGKFYELPSTDSMTDARKKSSCADDKFIIDFNATLLYDGTVIGKQVSKTSYFFEGDQLKMIRKTKVKGMPLPTQKFTCTRN